MVYGILNAMHIAHKFEHLLNTHRRRTGIGGRPNNLTRPRAA
jgi:hypothetical protein